MITITHSLSPNGVISLDLKGHADCVGEGADPVCAAVSILVYTLAEEMATMAAEGLLKRSPHILLQSGDAHLSFLPTPKGERRGEEIFNMAMTGFWLLEKSYPHCVRVTPQDHK